MPEDVRLPDDVESLAAFLREEGVPAGARILDVPCGIGRRALGLARVGYRVTAVDANEIAIDAARARIPDGARARLTYAASPRDHLPGLPQAEGFDAILCLDHAIDQDDAGIDARCLSRLHGHAEGGCPLVVEFLNRDFLASRPRSFAFHVLGNVEQHEFRRFDPVAGVLHLERKVYERSGENLRFRTQSEAALRLHPPHEVGQLLDRAGWRSVSFYGGWDRTPVASDRQKLVAVGHPARD